MNQDYWQQQEPGKALFPDIEWNKPERREQRGRLGIIGGNKLGFAGVAEAYSIGLSTGAGEVKVLLPDILKKSIPSAITETVFSVSTSSGGLSKDAEPDLTVLGEWASGILFVGDAGRNSETAILYEKFLKDYTKPVTITRDAFDLIKNNPELIANRENTMLVLSFAQVQKLFQSLYYPKVLTFSMHLMQFVEALHAFTTTYPVTIVTLHRENVLVAHGGDVVTMKWDNPMMIWRGTTATKAATYWMWSPSQPLEAAATSLLA